MKILVVATHPDDEVLGCGGVMARHAAAGDEVHVVVATRGVPDIFPPALVEQTRGELKEAHEVLGVRATHFLDFPAPRLDTVPHHELADALRKVVMTVRPQIMYTPHRGDIHLDHRHVFLASLVATRPIEGCTVERILSYETMSETEWSPPFAESAFVPNVFVDITEFLDRKLKAMACYRTQLKDPPHSRSLATLDALARLRGNTVGLGAAEAFTLVREVVR